MTIINISEPRRPPNSADLAGAFVFITITMNTYILNSPSSIAKTAYQKSPLTLEEQCNLLKSRGLIIDDIDYAISSLKQIGYYRLEAYALVFQEDTQKHIYRKNTDFKEIVNLYYFDRELRSILLGAIQSIEITLRTSFAYNLSCNYKDAFAHTKAEYFSNKEIKNKKGLSVHQYDALIDKLKYEYNESDEVFIDHFKNKYKNVNELPPIWMCTELMTLGELSKWIQAIKATKDKKAVADWFNIPLIAFASFLKNITVLRNLSAHHARVWNRVFSCNMSTSFLEIDFFKNNLNKEEFIDTKRKNLYNRIVMIEYVLRQLNSPVKFISEIKDLIGRYNIPLESMGFPANYSEMPIWN